jgi:hypothetical protein
MKAVADLGFFLDNFAEYVFFNGKIFGNEQVTIQNLNLAHL